MMTLGEQWLDYGRLSSPRRNSKARLCDVTPSQIRSIARVFSSRESKPRPRQPPKVGRGLALPDRRLTPAPDPRRRLRNKLQRALRATRPCPVPGEGGCLAPFSHGRASSG